MLEVIKSRHSVRQYLDKSIPTDIVEILQKEVNNCNLKSGLDIRLMVEEPLAFTGMMAKYGRFQYVKNYFAICGKKNKLSKEKAGYYGEKLVLKAQELGLNTCWVALTYNKAKCPVKPNKKEEIIIVIALGYGANQGNLHKSKPLTSLYSSKEEVPSWFIKGVEYASLAPTAINQQQFVFNYKNGVATAKAKIGPCNLIDLGIVKYHFELGAEKENYFNL
ncbi:MAG: nitroreductase [Clostridia bacterium]|nr:nitroreductase [Clostridia bacterium]